MRLSDHAQVRVLTFMLDGHTLTHVLPCAIRGRLPQLFLARSFCAHRGVTVNARHIAQQATHCLLQPRQYLLGVGAIGDLPRDWVLMAMPSSI